MTTNSEAYVGGAKVKIPLHVQMRGIYIQWRNWPLWLYNFPHDYLTYMTLQLYMWVSLTSTLHYIVYNSMAHSSHVAEISHDMTRHDNAGMFMPMVVFMLICSDAEWWVCYLCIIASVPHDKVSRVFDGLGVWLMFHVHISPSLVLGVPHVFVYSRTSLLACAPCSSYMSSHHVSSMYLYLQSLMTRRHKI